MFLTMSLAVVVALLLGGVTGPALGSQQDADVGRGRSPGSTRVAAGGGGSRPRRSGDLGCYELDGDVYLTASSNPFTCLDQVRLCLQLFPVFYTHYVLAACMHDRRQASRPGTDNRYLIPKPEDHTPNVLQPFKCQAALSVLVLRTPGLAPDLTCNCPHAHLHFDVPRAALWLVGGGVQANTLNRLVGACTGVVGTIRCDTVDQFGVTVLLEQGNCDVTAAGLAAVVTEVRGFAPRTDCSISGYIKDDTWCTQTTAALSFAMVSTKHGSSPRAPPDLPPPTSAPW